MDPKQNRFMKEVILSGIYSAKKNTGYGYLGSNDLIRAPSIICVVNRNRLGIRYYYHKGSCIYLEYMSGYWILTLLNGKSPVDSGCWKVA